jgi:hypothetical protein
MQDKGGAIGKGATSAAYMFAKNKLFAVYTLGDSLTSYDFTPS